MTIDEAFEVADMPMGRALVSMRVEACDVLAAEVRRLRAGVEAIRALPSYDHMDTYMAMRDVGDWIDRDEVLDILEGTVTNGMD